MGFIGKPKEGKMKPGPVTGKWAKAQGIVEFALAIPIILFAVLVIFEVAYVIITFNGVAMASREASRYGAGMSTSQAVGSPLSHWQDCQGIRDAARRIGGFLGISDSDIHIFYDSGPDALPADAVSKEICAPDPIPQVSKGGRITVKVTAHYAPLSMLIQMAPIPISSLSSHTILTGIPIVQ
jgi:hypothetical protein